MGELVPAQAGGAAGSRLAVAATAVRGLSRFAMTRGIPPGREFLLDYDVIEAFCVAGLPGRASSTRGTCRSALYRLARPVHGAPGQRATPFAGAGAPAPYSPAERAGLAAMAAAQRDPARRASALAVVVFGIGAGLRPGELVALRGSDVIRRGRIVAVHAGGPAARVVPVTAAYAGRAAGLAAGAGNGHLFRPGPADRGYKNFVTNFARTLAADPAAPRLTLSRCRSSFICDHLAAGTPVAEVLAITGICRAESLARYARHAGGAPAKAVLRAWDKRLAGALMDGGGLGIPVPGRAPGEQAVAFAAELIDRSGKAPVIEAALAHRTGRHRPLPVRAVLTALLCLALDDRPLFLTEVTRLLFCQLPPASRRLLGVPGAAATERAFQNAYRRVRYCFHAILSVADPSPLPKNRRLTRENLQARTKPMTPGQATAARGRLEALVNALLEASVSVLTQDERAALGGGTGLDATPVPLFSRGPSRRTGLSASDPDGGWYAREGDHREREDDKGKPLRKICWALEAAIAATARPPGAPPGCPDLAIGMAMARPGEDPGGTGARVLTSAAARGHKPGWPGYDRACTQALPERFHLPARALGYQPVMDYRDDQLGIQANTGGAILVEGTWYCPALPEPLITATTRLRGHAITRDLYHQQITARACYQLKHKDGPDADGYQRLSCPALGTHPGLICPLRGTSLSPRDGRPRALQPPQEPPRLCRQATITIAPDAGARYRQDLPYGSPAWHARYATLRNTIEGLNGLVKDTAHEALAAPARRRVRGIAACSLFTALLLMAANIRKIRAWRALTASDQAGITRRARRRRTSLRDYLPDG